MADYPFLHYAPERLPPAEMQQRATAFREHLSQRRSVRQFSSDPVPRALIEQAILTASSSPSGANRQPWTFVAISDASVKRQIRVAAEAEERQTYEGGRMPTEWREAIAHFKTDWHKPYLDTVPWIVVAFEQTYGLDAEGGAGRTTT